MYTVDIVHCINCSLFLFVFMICKSLVWFHFLIPTFFYSFSYYVVVQLHNCIHYTTITKRAKPLQMHHYKLFALYFILVFCCLPCFCCIYYYTFFIFLVLSILSFVSFSNIFFLWCFSGVSFIVFIHPLYKLLCFYLFLQFINLGLIF